MKIIPESTEKQDEKSKISAITPLLTDPSMVQEEQSVEPAEPIFQETVNSPLL